MIESKACLNDFLATEIDNLKLSVLQIVLHQFELFKEDKFAIVVGCIGFELHEQLVIHIEDVKSN